MRKAKISHEDAVYWSWPTYLFCRISENVANFVQNSRDHEKIWDIIIPALFREIPEKSTEIYRCEKKKESVRSLFKYYIAKDYNLFFDRIEWIKSDILDIIDLRDAMEGAKQIYHCAGLVSFHKRDFNKLLKINYEGTSNIVNLALEIKNCKLCYVSSTAAIGGENNEYINEKSKWKNTPKTSGYSVSKYSAEREVWRAIQEGLNAVIVNPCVIIGAGNWKLSSLKIFVKFSFKKNAE